MAIIIHVDMDAFFASVEVLDNPALRGKPLVVGGPSTRGVVAAASYEARKFGIHSAMPMVTALRLCPKLIVVRGHMAQYSAVSAKIMSILAEYSPLIEPMSLDEAYLDVTDWLPLHKSATDVAKEIQRRIFIETNGLTASVGVAAGKAIAKMASDFNKPRGLMVVRPGSEAEFLAPMAIEKLRGVGKASELKLRALGIKTIGELAQCPPGLITGKFGEHGRDLLALAQGIDDSPVVPERQAKSIGREKTFLQDVADSECLSATLLELTEGVAAALRANNLLATGINLKIRYGDFTTFTRAMRLPEPMNSCGPLYSHALEMLTKLRLKQPLRLLGITATTLLPIAEQQLSLFSNPTSEKHARIDLALDAVRARFGKTAIKRARLAEDNKEESK